MAVIMIGDRASQDKRGIMDLFPAIEPFESGTLPVDDIHTLYWEQSGNPHGVPVVFVHGGPGAGCAPTYRRFFDPAHWRIILFDQRGCGRSTPKAETRANTTPLLVGDLETLRKHLGVERWMIFGGSWGSTLALAYGQKHPENCLAFVLRGIFLFRAREVDWFVNRMGTFFPEAHARFAGHIPQDERSDLLGAYHRRLMNADPAVHDPAARAWCAYEDSCSRLRPGNAIGNGGGPAPLAMARIEAHYMVNRGFLDEGQLLAHMPILNNHPAIIVQGRYDVVCPVATADALARSWPAADYHIIDDAGHSSMEPGIRSALVAATQKFRALS